MDVKNTFLHGELQEEVFMSQPQGPPSDLNLIYKLNRTLYDLKQAPRAWNMRFGAFIKRLGYRQSDYDKCMYIRIKGNIKIYLLLYVDDILMVSNNEKVLGIIKRSLEKEFCMKNLGELHYFLGIKIE